MDIHLVEGTIFQHEEKRCEYKVMYGQIELSEIPFLKDEFLSDDTAMFNGANHFETTKEVFVDGRGFYLMTDNDPDFVSDEVIERVLSKQLFDANQKVKHYFQENSFNNALDSDDSILRFVLNLVRHWHKNHRLPPSRKGVIVAKRASNI